MYDLVSLGELMLRLSPPKYERLRQAQSFDVRLCGAQFNLAADLALLGRRTAFLTRLPDNEIGWLARSRGGVYGVDMSLAPMVPDSRLGITYVDFGVEPRSAAHLYDRRGSAASAMSAEDFDWDTILQGARLAYTDGVFLSLSESCRQAALAFVGAAKSRGCTVCFDVNYREKTFAPHQAAELYRQVLPCVDVLVTNRFVSEKIFDYSGSDEALVQKYHDDLGCQTVCLTHRAMTGTSRGRWSSLALDHGKLISSTPRDFEVVDRWGTGDAFFAGFLHGYLDGDTQHALEFGNVLCALAHTIDGDVAEVSAAEVRDILDNGYTRRPKR